MISTSRVRSMRGGDPRPRLGRRCKQGRRLPHPLGNDATLSLTPQMAPLGEMRQHIRDLGDRQPISF